MIRARRLAAVLGGAGLGIACVSGPFDLASLEQRYPALDAAPEHRLADVNPYLLPLRGQVWFFLCRWPSDEPIPVSLPPDATDAERAGFADVMRAWEGAGLGVRFAPDASGEPTRSGIEVRFIEPAPGANELRFAANTVTDCAVDPAALDGDPGDPLPARLVRASIHLWRGGFDAIGRPVPHSNAEFAGSALHEFGHALGFQGHARVGRTVMVRETDVSRRAGRNLLAGKPFTDDTLRALYALPSGTVLLRAAVDPRQTERVERMAEIARKRGLEGPLVRVGDVDGRVAWRAADGREYSLRIYEARAVLRDPSTLWLRPTLVTSELLDPS